MPLLDLSQVTETLIRLLRRYLAQPRLWGLGPGEPVPNVSITGDPPDLLAQKSDDYAIGLYLYHLQEDAHHKNLPEPSGSSPPVRFREMGLNLFYLLTAHGGNRPETQPYLREQRLMGLAVKAFHDFPVLDAATEIGSGADRFIFLDALRQEEDEFRLTLHPAPLEEMTKVWTAATVPVRLSAVYQVSVVLLEAEKPALRQVPVLVPHIDAGRLQPLWIQATASDCVFTLPGESRSRSVTHTPALVAVGESFRVLGSGLGETANRIFLTSPVWAEPPNVDVTAWVTARCAETHVELVVSSPAAGRAIVPGLYQVYVQSGTALSNFSPLAVAPLIAPQTAPTPGIDPQTGPAETLFAINGGPFSGPAISSVGVLLGAQLLRQTSGAPGPAEFRVAAENRIEVRVPAGQAVGPHAVRVVVNGIGTLPTRWFEVTI